MRYGFRGENAIEKSEKLMVVPILQKQKKVQ